MTQPSSLRRRASLSAVWSIVRVGIDQLVSFGVFAAMTHYLQPSAFGVFVMALTYAEFGRILASAGLVSSLYQAPEITPAMADTIFWANTALAFAVAILGSLFRYQVADALGSPQAADLMGAIGFTIPVAALGGSHMSRHLREFGHKAMAVRSAISGVVGGGLAILGLMHGLGVWSLVIQRYVVALATTGVAWWSFRWMPGRAFSWKVLRAQLGLGGSVAFSDILLVLLARSQDLIITRMLGLHATGIYRVSWKTVEVISQGMIIPISGVATPALSKLQHDMAAFERGYLRIVAATAFLALPAIAGVGALSDQIIPLLYGMKWHEAIAPALVLTLMGLPFLLNNFAAPALLVLRKAKAIAQLSVLQLGGTLLFCLLAAPYGLVAIAAAYVARAYLTMACQLWLLQCHAGIRGGAVLRVVAPSLVASTVMAIGLVVFSGYVFPMPPHPTTVHRILRLAGSVACGATVYLGIAALLVGAEQRGRLVTIATRLLRKAQPVPAPA